MLLLSEDSSGKLTFITPENAIINGAVVK